MIPVETNDLAAWIHDHPRLETTDPEPVTVAGIVGEQFDVVLRKARATRIPIAYLRQARPQTGAMARLGLSRHDRRRWRRLNHASRAVTRRVCSGRGVRIK